MKEILRNAYSLLAASCLVLSLGEVEGTICYSNGELQTLKKQTQELMEVLNMDEKAVRSFAEELKISSTYLSFGGALGEQVVRAVVDRQKEGLVLDILEVFSDDSIDVYHLETKRKNIENNLWNVLRLLYSDETARLYAALIVKANEEETETEGEASALHKWYVSSSEQYELLNKKVGHADK